MQKSDMMNMPRREAVELIASACRRTLETETVPLQEACGRVAAEDIASQCNLPDVPCSRWDGISFSFDAYTAAGGRVDRWQEEKDFRFTNTGIGIFCDAFDTMVRIEDAEFVDGRLHRISQSTPVVRGQNVIPIGERMRVGEVLVPKDTWIRPSHISLVASGGNLTVSVYRKPVVVLIPSGDELVPRGVGPRAGQTIESNTCSMRAKVEQWGGRALVWPILRDDAAELRTQLLRAAATADVIVISGGSGRGQHDLLQPAIAGIGELIFSDVEHGPGKRTCFAVVDGVPVIGLVGPPGGEEMTFDFYAVPAIRAMLNQPHRETTIRITLEEDVPPHPRVDFYFTMYLYRDEQGVLRGRPLPHSRLDRSIAEHNGYLLVPKEGSGYRKGERVTAELRIGYENV